MRVDATTRLGCVKKEYCGFIVWLETLDDFVLVVTGRDELLLPVGKLIGGGDGIVVLLLPLLLGGKVGVGLWPKYQSLIKVILNGKLTARYWGSN